MILVSENSTADNGTEVQSTVQLFIERVGVEELPFRVDVSVGHVRLCHSHHATEVEAKGERARMHASYLQVHGSGVAA